MRVRHHANDGHKILKALGGALQDAVPVRLEGDPLHNTAKTLDQKHTLDLFLERGAISREQYDRSLGDLPKKMEM